MSELTYIAHHGVKGQKHGVRQYQNRDGSLTPLGRVHYGVGAARKAASNVKEAIRKKVAPTNAELNVQIRKQKAKNLNKQKREQLRQLKKGIDIDEVSNLDKGKVSGPHKKFSEMSDQEIKDRMNRLTNEIKLAELEATKNMGPGKRMVYTALRDSAAKAIGDVTKDALTKAGKKMLGIEDKKSEKEDTKTFKQLWEEIENKQKIEDYYKEHPEKHPDYKPESKVAKAAKKAASDAGKAAASGAKKAASGAGKAVASGAKKAASGASKAARSAYEKAEYNYKKKKYAAKGQDYRGKIKL